MTRPVEAERGASYIIPMAVYLARDCPFCGNYFGVVIAKRNVVATVLSNGAAATADTKSRGR
jgi:hypothetical protein